MVNHLYNQIKEIVRNAVRKHLPFKIYKFTSKLINLSTLVKRNELALIKYAFHDHEDIEKIYVRSIDKNIWIRANSPDYHCVVQNLVREEYKFAKQISCPQIIIDAGGYIGDTALYFNKLHPTANVIVLEPNSSNYEMCKKNLSDIENITLKNVGLADRQGGVEITNTFWSSKTKFTNESSSIKSITVDSILDEFEFKNLSLLKMDIEGGETRILNDRFAKWPSKTDMIIVETHGIDSINAVLRFAKCYDYTIEKYRSLQILKRR